MSSWEKIAFPALFLCISLLSGCSDPDQREAKYIKHGIELFDQGQLEKARLEFKNAARIKPTDAEPRYRLALVDEAQGDLRNAFVGFSHAVEQNARHRLALLKLAQYYLAAERYQESQRYLDTVLTDTPNDPEAHALHAALLLRQQKYAECEAEAKFALKQDPANTTATSVLTGLYLTQGEEAKAIEALEAGIARNPNNIGLFQLKVAVYKKLNKIDGIKAAYEALFRLKPEQASFRAELAKAYLEANRSDDAEAVLRGGIKAAPAEIAMKRQLVLFLSENRGLDAAEAEIKSYIAADKKNQDYYFWLADLYMVHHAVDRAVTLLEQVVSQDRFEPPGLTARTSLARINFQQGNRDLAEKLLAVVLEKDPSNPDALFMRSSIEFDRGQYQSAVADLRSIIRDRPKAKDAYQLLAETLIRQGRLDLAIDTLAQLVDLDPLNSAARVRLAQMYHLNGDSARAMTLLQIVTKADPNYPIGWESTARISIDRKDWQTAEDAISHLEKIDGQKLTGTFLRGEIASINGKTDDAIKQYAQVISADPDTPLAEHALTAITANYRRAGKVEAAAHYLESVKSASPIVNTILGECYAELGKLDLAAKQFDTALEGTPNRPEPYLDRAKLFIAGRNMEQAVDVLKKGMAAVPVDVQIPMLLAELYANSGRYGDAAGLYDDLLARNPSLDAAANNLAELIADYQFNDNVALDKARRVAERFQGTNNPFLQDTLGWVYYRLGRMDQAMPLLSRAASSPQASAQIHYHYGLALMKSGNNGQAKEHLELAAKSNAVYPGIEEAKRLAQQL